MRGHAIRVIMSVGQIGGHEGVTGTWQLLLFISTAAQVSSVNLCLSVSPTLASNIDPLPLPLPRYRQPFYAQASPRRPPHLRTPGHSAGACPRFPPPPSILSLCHRAPAQPAAASVYSIRTSFNLSLSKSAMFWCQRRRSRTLDRARSVLLPAFGHYQGGKEENIDQQFVYRSRGRRACERYRI